LTALTAPAISDDSGANKVTFDAVSGAVGYEVYLDGVYSSALASDAVEYVYGASFGGTVSIIANGNYMTASDSVASNVITTALTALATPVLTDASISEKVTWIAISGAVSYKFYIDAALIATYGSASTEASYGLSTGALTVMAVGDGTTKADSAVSNTITIT
jgi:hypothetical protein